MRQLIIIVMLFFVSSSAFSSIKIQHWKTSTGSEVFFVPITNLPMIDIRVVFAAGSAYDGENQGLAMLTNNMLGEGTTTQDANQIAKAFDNVGSFFNTGANRDEAIVSLRSLSKPEFFNGAIKTFIQVISKMSFTEKVLHRVKNQTIAMIKVKEQNADNIAGIALYKIIYGNQPYAHNPLGTISSVKHIMAGEVKQFYHRYYVAKNSHIILVGHLTKEKAKQIAENISNTLPIGRAAPQLVKSKILQHDVRQHIPFPTKQSAIMIGQVGINRTNPDYFPLIVGNYIFGGLPLGSILFQKVRNQNGLAYYAGSVFQPLRYRGPFLIELKTRAEKTKKALKIVQNALDTFLQEGPSEQELDSAKQNLVGGFPLKISNNYKIAAIVTQIAFYHRPLNYLNTYKKNIQRVTTEQIKKAFAKIIDTKRLAVITVGPSFQK